MKNYGDWETRYALSDFPEGIMPTVTNFGNELARAMYKIEAGKKRKSKTEFDASGVMGALDYLKSTVLTDPVFIGLEQTYKKIFIQTYFLSHLSNHKTDIRLEDIPSLRSFFRNLAVDNGDYIDLKSEFEQSFPLPSSADEYDGH